MDKYFYFELKGGDEMSDRGPISNDLRVACMIYDFKKRGIDEVEYSQLVDSFSNASSGGLSKPTILRSLNTLSQWGVVKTIFGETSRGRAGRLFSVSGESESMIREIYDEFWERVRPR